MNRKALERENEQLRELLSQELVNQTMLHELVIKDGKMSIALEGGPCRLMAEAFASLLVEFGAENYIESYFVSKDFLPGEYIVVTVHRVSGKTPHQKRAEAESRHAALIERLDGLVDTLKLESAISWSECQMDGYDNAAKWLQKIIEEAKKD